MSVPSTTRAVWIERFGGPEVVGIETVSIPPLEPGEVLIRTSFASINPVDWKTSEGKYPPMGADKLPFGLGRDLSGTIAALGENGSQKVGSRACAFIGNERGAQSEYVVVKSSEIALVPDGVEQAIAGAVPLAAMTAWQGLFDHGGLAKGQRVLVHGGAGGVGHLAVQLARWTGATVFATASKHDLDFVRDLGADTVIDYEHDRFEDIATDLDVVFDTQGGETQARSFGALRKGGILVSTLEPDEKKAAEMGVRTVPRWHAEPNGAQLSQVLELIVAGEVAVTVDRIFGFDAVRDAQAFVQHEHPRGKVILSFGDV